MEKTVILGVKLNQRVGTAPKFQEIITKHGCNIKSRIGLHNVENGKCSPSGVILLEVIGDDAEINEIEKDIKDLGSAELQKMVFNL